MFFFEYKQQLIEEFRRPLPQKEAWRVMAPKTRLLSYDCVDRQSARNSAVLLLLYPTLDTMKFVLIERANGGGKHSGQIGFPGGEVELSDNHIVETALREAVEEVGIVASDVEIIGLLSELYIQVSNFIVQPVVGYISYAPRFQKNSFEVQSIIEVDLSILFDSCKRGEKNIDTEYGSFTAPYYDISGNHVWGATAMIMSEFAEMLRQSQLNLYFTA